MSGGAYDAGRHEVSEIKQTCEEMLEDLDEHYEDGEVPTIVTERLEKIKNALDGEGYDGERSVFRDVDYLMCGDYSIETLQEKYNNAER